MLAIHIERPSDFESVREVLAGAFARSDEADLVDRLRDDALRIASLVAVDGGRVAGYAMFSRVWIDDGGATTAIASLAPVAVTPECQRRGIGSALIERGIEMCRADGWPAIVVVGHTAYYPRFGFSAATVAHLDTPYSGDHFMGLELHAGALTTLRGRVRYPACFEP